MNILRRAHLLLGCLFAPLLLYYCVSGAWQTLGYNRHRNSDGTQMHPQVTQLSNPHVGASMPGASSKGNQSQYFKYAAVAMSVGISITLILGVVMAFRYFKPRWVVFSVLLIGFALPLAFLWIAVNRWDSNHQISEPSRPANPIPPGTSAAEQPRVPGSGGG